MDQRIILEELGFQHVENVDPYLPFPAPFMGKGPIKAIVLGAGPSTDSGARFETIFNLNGPDRRYFAGIERNLNLIGLTIDNVYVQNICQNYFTSTTYKQRNNWWRASAIWYHFLKKELNERFDMNIPLLITSEIIFRRLSNVEINSNEYYYLNPDEVPVESNPIASGRLLIPIYRHWKYNLERAEWSLYKERLKNFFINA